MRVFRGPSGLLYVVEENGRVTNIDLADNTVIPAILSLEDISDDQAKQCGFVEFTQVTFEPVECKYC